MRRSEKVDNKEETKRGLNLNVSPFWLLHLLQSQSLNPSATIAMSEDNSDFDDEAFIASLREVLGEVMRQRREEEESRAASGNGEQGGALT